MSIQKVHSFASGHWIAPDANARSIESAITGQIIAEAGAKLDTQGMLAYARDIGGPNLRALTFHDRARMLKALAAHLNAHKQHLYELSYDTGATLKDHKIDIDGGIGTVFVFASKGRREMPDAQVYVDGNIEQLSRNGTFLGQHICTPLQGVAVHINAFNFPVWGMLEKLAPAILGGVPCIVKPATATCYVTEACVQLILDSGILSDGALQLVAGQLGDMLDHLGAQDVVGFTGSAATALTLRSNPKLAENSVRFLAEQDSLNASILGTDAVKGSPEFDLFVSEAVSEMTTKAGQKCTAIRRIIAPDTSVEPLLEALGQRLGALKIGDPRDAGNDMGALVSTSQRADVLDKIETLRSEANLVSGALSDATTPGAFMAPVLLHCETPDSATAIHNIEAFGPVGTVMGYRDTDHAVELLNKGKGSLVASVFTRDPEVARGIAMGSAAWHGRLYFNNRDSQDEATGHGSPLPHMTHGGPGRAGGGEELGGVRGVMHYMQRTAVQGSPDILTAITGNWVPGATEKTQADHPFTRSFGALQIGETLHTPERRITVDDIDHFANFTGDTFYAHMDDDAAKANPFFPGRVAHGYLLLSFAAGLFVEPNVGPVLANTGLDNLRFMKPVEIDDRIKVRLTVKKKTYRNEEYGEVRWHVTLTNQLDELVAEYDLLTMNAH